MAIIDVAGDLDKSATDVLEFALTSLAVRGKNRVVLNLANVDFICSTSLGMVGRFYRRLQRAGGALVLLQPTDNVRRVITITRLCELIRIVDTEQQAVAEAGGNG